MAQGWMWPGTSRNAAQQWGNLNPALRNRLRSFYDHAEKSGYATAARPISSYRTREDQIRAGRQVAARLDRTYDPNVGIPGYAASADGSRHRRGEAIDWTFRNPEAQKWFHENAKNYGLAFPIETDAPHMQLVRDWNGELKPVTPEGNPAAGSFRAAQESGFNDTAPAPQVAGYVARETNQGQSMADRQPPSMFGALARGFSSPQFMAGAAMFDSALRGGGISQGAQMLQSAQQQEQEMAYRQAQQQRADAIRQQQFSQQAPLNAARLKLYEAQAAKASAWPNSENFGKSGAIFQGKDGIFRGVQFGSNGSVKIHPFDSGMSPARGVATVDEATGTRVIDKSTGADVRQIPKNIAGAEREKKIGANQGEVIAETTRATASAASTFAQNTTLNKFIDEAIKQADGFGTTGLIGSVAKNIGGSPANDLSKTLSTIKANIGFDKLQDMRNNSKSGGALGAVSEKEMELLTSVWGSVEQSQSKGQLQGNLARFKRTYAASMVRLKNAYEEAYGRGSWKNVLNMNTKNPDPAPQEYDVKSLTNDELLKRLGAK
jgi:hypothetical protein